MASRAEARIGEERPAASPIASPIAPAIAPPSVPRLGVAIRAAFTDYYFNSMRLVSANVVWGAGLVVIVVVGLVWPLGGLLLLPLLALPTAGIFRMAARIVRVAPDPGLARRPVALSPCRRRIAGPRLRCGRGKRGPRHEPRRRDRGPGRLPRLGTRDARRLGSGGGLERGARRVATRCGSGT